MNKLYLDTTNNKEIKIAIKINGKKYEKVSKESRSGRILPQILKLLKKNKLGIRDLDEIWVNPGPGSFTGIRVGVSIANALSQALNIPVNGKRGNLVDPKYK